MAKRKLTPTETTDAPAKHIRISKAFAPVRVATAEIAAKVDADPPLLLLQDELKKAVKKPQIGDSVIYWMRMADLRIRDNRALSRASEYAKFLGIPLLVFFVLSPQDYIAHDRSARRIDFTLRNLSLLKKSLFDLNIPLSVTSHRSRKTMPSYILSLCDKYGTHALFANIEYEVDELRRDLELCKLALLRGIQVNFLHNKCVIEPGLIVTKQHKAYSVHAPYQRNWTETLNGNLSYFLEDCPVPASNHTAVRSTKVFSPLFDAPVPESLQGFGLEHSDKLRMQQVWPEGEEVALKILGAFLGKKSRSSQLGAVSPLAEGAEDSSKHSRLLHYEKDRDRADCDSTSRLSVYLSSGVISVRECIRATMRMLKTKKVDSDGKSGVGKWIQEIAWRDFYTNILAAFPRVCMGRPYIEKYSQVVWENHQVQQQSAVGHRGNTQSDAEALMRWKEGRTGVPIVDATMRCINEMGWVHNRARMITAMYLTKDLMIDWHIGEQYFMQKLIDGDFASNNGGWQWCASTGADPAPYFRIFNPHSQSDKADPTGDFIRHWVPELRKLKGSALHNPSASVANELGYPVPVIPHNEARKRALRRYRNPGVE